MHRSTLLFRGSAGNLARNAVEGQDEAELVGRHHRKMGFSWTRLRRFGVDLALIWRRFLISPARWTQGVMNAALLGLTKEAMTDVVSRAKTAPAKGYRFQGFAPHEQDYEPSQDNFDVILGYLARGSHLSTAGHTCLVPVLSAPPPRRTVRHTLLMI